MHYIVNKIHRCISLRLINALELFFSYNITYLYAHALSMVPPLHSLHIYLHIASSSLQVGFIHLTVFLVIAISVFICTFMIYI